jgi:hypothetical protein
VIEADGADVMIVQVNTDHHIHGSLALQEDVTAAVETALSNHAGRITRLELHLSDQNGKKGGEADLRCAIEARLEGLPPLGVHHDAAVLMDAVEGAAQRLQHLIDHHLGRLQGR